MKNTDITHNLIHATILFEEGIRVTNFLFDFSYNGDHITAVIITAPPIMVCEEGYSASTRMARMMAQGISVMLSSAVSPGARYLAPSISVMQAMTNVIPPSAEITISSSGIVNGLDRSGATSMSASVAATVGSVDGMSGQ